MFYIDIKCLILTICFLCNFSHMLLAQCMVFEEHKRIGFKEVLDTLDPDLKADFKKKAFYHNEFKSKLTVKRSKLNESTTTKIANPNGDFDNYM